MYRLYQHVIYSVNTSLSSWSNSIEKSGSTDDMLYILNDSCKFEWRWQNLGKDPGILSTY